MIPAAGFSWFRLIPAVDEGFLPFAHGHDYLLVSACFVSAVLIGFGVLANRALAARMQTDGLAKYQADGSLSVFTIAESLVSFLRGMQDGLLDKANQRRWTPLIGTLFVYILVCNYLALIPGFQPPTDDVNANVGMALIVLVVYWGVGLLTDPKSFIAHIMGPVWWLVPLIALIELMTLVIVRPATLAIRLTGNIFADHLVFGVMSDLVPILIPVPFLMLGLIVSTVQAFVFTLLSTIYISLSLPHGHDDDHDHH